MRWNFFVYTLLCLYCSHIYFVHADSDVPIQTIPDLSVNETTTGSAVIVDEVKADKQLLSEVHTPTESKPNTESSIKTARSIPGYRPLPPIPYNQPTASYAPVQSYAPLPSYGPAPSYTQPSPSVPCYNNIIESCTPVYSAFPCGTSITPAHAATLSAPSYRYVQPPPPPPRAYQPPPPTAYQPPPPRAYQPPPRPAPRPIPQHIYTAPVIQSYSAPAPQVQCGGNTLIGCSPSVTTVPCSSYSPSY